MSGTAEDGPERLGRFLGRTYARGQIAARRMAGPARREQLSRAGYRFAGRAEPMVREVADRARQELAARGPDVAEQVAQRAVDRVLWGLGGRFGLLTAAIRPLAGPARNAAGALARDLAKAAGGGEQGDVPPRPLPEADSRPDGSERSGPDA